MDNASPNDVLARTLARLLLKRYNIHFAPENAQIRCLAHVVNLVVQKILSELLGVDDPALDDYYELWKHLPIHFDVEAEDQADADAEEERAKETSKMAGQKGPSEPSDLQGDEVDELDWDIEEDEELKAFLSDTDTDASLERAGKRAVKKVWLNLSSVRIQTLTLKLRSAASHCHQDRRFSPASWSVPQMCGTIISRHLC